jgi:hypothetical protein
MYRAAYSQEILYTCLFKIDIAARDFIALVAQYGGNAAHAYAANANKMDMGIFFIIFVHERPVDKGA